MGIVAPRASWREIFCENLRLGSKNEKRSKDACGN